MLQIDAKTDADRLIVEAEEKYPERPIMALSWMTCEGPTDQASTRATAPPTRPFPTSNRWMRA
jgi:hypothetical protein